MSTPANKNKRIWQILLAVCIGTAVAAAVLLTLHLLPRDRDVVSSTPVVSTTPTVPVELPDNPIDFAALQAKNSDVCGWIKIPGTVIDYAVMYSGKSGKEDFYLHHAEDRKYRFAGSIYMQQLNQRDFTDPNTVLYGHNMKNGSMFAALHKFEKQDFFEKNQYIYVYTPGHILTYRIFTAFVYDDRHVLNSFNFSDREEYAAFLEQSLHPQSMVKQVREGVTVTPDDRIITLSTCTNRDTERYLVEGVLIHDQPTK